MLKLRLVLITWRLRLPRSPAPRILMRSRPPSTELTCSSINNHTNKNPFRKTEGVESKTRANYSLFLGLVHDDAGLRGRLFSLNLLGGHGLFHPVVRRL